MHFVDPSDEFGITRDYFKWTERNRNKGCKILLAVEAPRTWKKSCCPGTIKKELDKFLQDGAEPVGKSEGARKFY